MPWYRIDARAKEDGALLPGFDDLIFDKGVAFTTDSAAVSAARAAAGFGVGKIQDTELAPGRLHFDKAGSRPVFVSEGPPAPLGGGDGFEAIVADAGGILAGQPLRMAATAGEVTAVLEDTTDGTRIYGVADIIGAASAAAAQGEKIKVASAGVVQALAGASIEKGRSVVANGVSGKFVHPDERVLASGVGSGQLLWILRRPHVGALAQVISLTVTDANFPETTVVILPQAVQVRLRSNSEGDSIATAAEVAAAVNAHPIASQLVKVELGGDGTGISSNWSASFQIDLQWMNTVGIALADAEQDELFPLLIRPR
jgi:hypothetical protein